MSGTEHDRTDLPLISWYEPEAWDGVGEDPHDVANPVTGFYYIGTEIDGVRIPLVQRKAAGLFADFRRAAEKQANADADTKAKQQAAQQAPQSADTQPADTQPADTQPTQ